MEWIYLACFFLGLFYAVLSGIFSGVFGGHGDVDLSGHDLDVGGHDIGDAGGAGEGHGADAHFSPLSPVVLSMFMVGFGGAGSICVRMDLPIYIHTPLAVGIGLFAGGITFLGFARLFRAVEGTSQPTQQDVIGSVGEVTVPIPKDGVGQIAVVLKSARYTKAARSEDGTEIPARRPVVVQRIVGATCFVKEQEAPPTPL